MALVFVYGTLKRGQSNVHVMQGARFVAAAVTVQRWRLVALPHYPALVREESEQCMPVVGEVWDVPDPMLAMLDRFEEVPDLYTRHEIEVDHASLPGQPVRVRAQAYFMPAAQAACGRLLPGGRWPA